jgi:hypothetical protein
MNLTNFKKLISQYKNTAKKFKKNMFIFPLVLISFILFSCDENNTSENFKTNNSNSIRNIRTEYLRKNDWIAPEDMTIIEKGFTPINERGFWDEDKRKQAFIDKLKKNHFTDSVINKLVVQVELIHGGRTGQWNYEYIQARFNVYKKEMAQDIEWKKIEAEYQKKSSSTE